MLEFHSSPSNIFMQNMELTNLPSNAFSGGNITGNVHLENNNIQYVGEKAFDSFIIMTDL